MVAQYRTFDEILKVLPQRDPFIFVDEVALIDVNNKIRVIKNVATSDCIKIHGEMFFPTEYLLEIGAQGAILLFYADGKNVHEVTTLIVGIDECRISGTIKAGIRIEAEVKYEKIFSKAAILTSVVKTGDTVVLETKMTVAFMKVS